MKLYDANVEVKIHSSWLLFGKTRYGSNSDYASEFNQFCGCKYYYEPKEHTYTRFLKEKSFHIKNVNAYIHYIRFTLFKDTWKKSNDIEIVTEDLPMSSPNLEEKDSFEMPQDRYELSIIRLLQLLTWLRLYRLFQLRKTQ